MLKLYHLSVKKKNDEYQHTGLLLHNTSLMDSPEGKILVVGLFGVGLYLIALLLSWLLSPEFYKAFIGMTFGNILFGRAAGITIGFAAGLEIWPVVSVNFIVELLSVLFTYPLFIFSWNQMLHFKRLKSWMENQHRFVEKYHDKIHKYGLYGLFAFVWFPFWMTGPAIGAMIGYVMGLRHAVTLSVVLSGTLLAISGWAWFLNALQQWAESFDPRAPWLVVALIVLIVIFGILFRHYRQAK